MIRAARRAALARLWNMARFIFPALLAALAFAQDDLERVFHFNHVATAQSLNEIATLVRVITDLPTLMADAEAHTIAFRGTPAQGALADWLMTGIDRRADFKSPRRFDAQVDKPDGENVVKMFYLQHTHGGQEIQDLATVVRSISEVRRLFTYNQEPLITVRTTASQSELVDWLVVQLDQAKPIEVEYRVSGDDDEVVRIFPLSMAQTPQQLHALATQVRTETKVRRLFTYTTRRVIAIRGTKAQLAQARELLYRGRL